MSELTIRRAVPADAAALARFSEQTFRDTFQADNSAADMDLYAAAHYGEIFQRAELLDPRAVVLVMESAGELIGFAHLLAGQQPAEVFATPAIELQRFYVAREYHGKGSARRLMDAVVSTSAALGAAAVWLGVWERNARAIAFYVKCRFADVGSQPFVLGTDVQTDRIMWRSIAP